jgi:hypothetical protein
MLDLNNICIGKIVKSNTHIDYICQIYNEGDTDLLPQTTDYTFGTFVGIELEAAAGGPVVGVDRIVGVIYNTLLLNPDFGNLGPRLSPRQELEIFSPDYLAETATLVGIITLGWRDTDGVYHQGVPALAATVNNFVHRLDDQELLLFHSDDASGPRLRYAPILLGQNNPLVPPLMIAVIDRLNDLFPGHQRQLTVMRNNLAWKSIVQPAG